MSTHFGTFDIAVTESKLVKKQEFKTTSSNRTHKSVMRELKKKLASIALEEKSSTEQIIAETVSEFNFMSLCSDSGRTKRLASTRTSILSQSTCRRSSNQQSKPTKSQRRPMKKKDSLSEGNATSFLLLPEIKRFLTDPIHDHMYFSNDNSKALIVYTPPLTLPSVFPVEEPTTKLRIEENRKEFEMEITMLS